MSRELRPLTGKVNGSSILLAPYTTCGTNSPVLILADLDIEELSRRILARRVG